jgi:fucose 4-O-acetylase-like acetyltransferase
MQKNTLGLLRLLDYASVLIVLYATLTRCWEPIRKALGWFFIPLGQASLYVFIIHVPVVAAVNNFLPFGFSTDPPRLWINTVAHTLALAALWLMVRYRVLFRWIPR